MIFRDFNHWFGNSKEMGLTSSSRDWAEAIWKELEPTIKASRDDYKKAYIELMNETANNNAELVKVLLEYISKYKKDDAPKFWRWYFDKATKDNEDA